MEAATNANNAMMSRDEQIAKLSDKQEETINRLDEAQKQAEQKRHQANGLTKELIDEALEYEFFGCK